jgi:hypothetical protein
MGEAVHPHKYRFSAIISHETAPILNWHVNIGPNKKTGDYSPVFVSFYV